MKKTVKKSLIVLLIFSLCFYFGLSSIFAQTINENNNENVSVTTTQSEDDVGENTITKFGDLDVKEIILKEKIPIENLDLPDVVDVYLNNGSNPTSLDVSWECPEYDKENTSYILKPIFEDKYILSKEIKEEDIPTIEVKINEDVKKEESKNTKNTSEKSKKVRSADNEYKIGTSGDYKDFTEALNALPDDNAGDVIFNVTDALYTGYDYKTVEIPTNKGITSLTIKTDLPSVKVDEYDRVSIFLNGIKFTLDSNIDMGSTIYGGGNGKDISSNADVTINENSAVTNIYGGSKNADLTGNTNIKVKGRVYTNLVGGCLSSANADNTDITANMHGSAKITIEETGQARYIYGGSMATVPNSGDVKLTSTSSVSGSVDILIKGLSEEVYGGGHAGPSSYVYKTTNTTCTNSVGGNISIIFTGSAKGANDNEMELYGGGRAMGTQSDTNHATLTVKGNINIEAIEDNYASVSQENNQAFNRFFGGGQALYSNAVLNVEGNVTIKSARACWESSMGLTGGGYALWGGTANVEGKIKLDLYKIDNQIAKYENVNLIIGGGLCEYTPEGSKSEATVGSTDITIHEGTTLISGSTTGLNIIGGGYTEQPNANVDVKGSTSIKLEDNLNFQRGICAGGVLRTSNCKNSSANVESTNLEFGDNINLDSGNIIGGGYINEAINASTDVKESINIKYGKNNNFDGKWLYGGSFINAGSGKANIGNNNSKDAIVITAEDGLKANQFICGGYIQNNMNKSEIKITGNINTNLKGGNINYFLGGGRLYASNGNVNIDGNITHNLSNLDIKGVYPGSASYSYNESDPGKANISGNVDTTIKNSQVNEGIYTGGVNYCDIEKNARLNIKDSTINANIYALGSNHSSIKNDSIISLLGSTTNSKYIFSYQNGTTCSAGRVLVEAGNEIETKTSTYTTGIYSTDNTKQTDVKINNNAELTLTYTGTDSPYHLMNINDIDIEKEGSLITKSVQNTPIKGNLTGNGTITIPSGGKITGSGKLDGNLTLNTTGTLDKDIEFFEFDKSSTGKVNFTDPNYKYYLKKEVGTDKAVWILKEGIIINTNTPNNGTITPGGKTMIGKGEPTDFTFTPDYGYQIDDVKVGGVSVKNDIKKHDDLRSSIYSLTMDINTSIEVSFKPLDKDTMEDIINNLPKVEETTPPKDEEIDKILDAKLDYEALSEEEKKKVDVNSTDNLHESLSKIPQIEVELAIKIQTGGNDIVNIDEEQKKRFLYSLDENDIKEVKENNTQLLKIVIEINDIEKPKDEEQEKINNVLSDYNIGKHFIVDVTKEKYQNKDDSTPIATEKITKMPQSVDLTFKIPDELKPKDNLIYTYAMIHTHFENGTYSSILLSDKDNINETVTISTNKFSTYTMVYKVSGTKPIVSYTVKFDTMGGSFIEPQEVEENGVVTVPKDPNKKNYKFKGWYIDKQCSRLWDFEKDKVTKNITLYAGWKSLSDNNQITTKPNDNSTGTSENRKNNNKNNITTVNTNDTNHLGIWIVLSIFTLTGLIILIQKAKKYN